MLPWIFHAPTGRLCPWRRHRGLAQGRCCAGPLDARWVTPQGRGWALDLATQPHILFAAPVARQDRGRAGGRGEPCRRLTPDQLRSSSSIQGHRLLPFAMLPHLRGGRIVTEPEKRSAFSASSRPGAGERTRILQDARCPNIVSYEFGG